MIIEEQGNRDEDLQVLCAQAKKLTQEGANESCRRLIAAAMQTYPDAPQPHNLMGALLEREGNHRIAMKHFRAAWALDPTYLPARKNLETYGTFFTQRMCAFEESDCLEEKQNLNEVSRMYGVSRSC